MKNQGAQEFPFSHVDHCYQMTMKVAAFGSVNKQQLKLRNFLWRSPQQHFQTLIHKEKFHTNFL